jgi:hypothetical protein
MVWAKSTQTSTNRLEMENHTIDNNIMQNANQFT